MKVFMNGKPKANPIFNEKNDRIVKDVFDM